MKIRGELQEKMPVQTYWEGDNQGKKQTLIFAEAEPEVEYPNTIAIDFSGENLILAGMMTVGEVYDVNYSIRCRKSEDWQKAFNGIRWRKIHAVSETGKSVSTKETADDECVPF